MKKNGNKIIIWFGNKFNFDAYYFTKNTFWVLIGQIMASLAAFIVTVVFANKIPKNILGDYRLIISIYSVLTFFALSGLSSALIRSIVNEQDGTLNVAVKIKKKYGIIAFIVGFGISMYFWVLRGNPIFGISILIMSLCLPIIESYSVYLPYLQAKHEFKHSSINSGIVKFISAIAVVITAFIFPQTIYLIAAFYISQTIVIYFQYKILTKKFAPKNNVIDSEMVSYSKHTTFAGVFYMFLGQADKFIIYHFFGPISLASYWIASTIPQEVGRLISTVLQVAYPKFVKGDHNTMKKVLEKKLISLTWVLLIVCFVYIFAAYPFFYIFFPQYLSEVSKSIILMFGFAVVPHMFVWQYFTAKKNIKVVYINNTVEPVLQVLLYISLIPFFGIWGLVFAVLIKTLVMNLIAWYSLIHY